MSCNEYVPLRGGKWKKPGDSNFEMRSVKTARTFPFTRKAFTAQSPAMLPLVSRNSFRNAAQAPHIRLKESSRDMSVYDSNGKLEHWHDKPLKKEHNLHRKISAIYRLHLHNCLASSHSFPSSRRSRFALLSAFSSSIHLTRYGALFEWELFNMKRDLSFGTMNNIVVKREFCCVVRRLCKSTLFDREMFVALANWAGTSHAQQPARRQSWTLL